MFPGMIAFPLKLHRKALIPSSSPPGPNFTRLWRIKGDKKSTRQQSQIIFRVNFVLITTSKKHIRPFLKSKMHACLSSYYNIKVMNISIQTLQKSTGKIVSIFCLKTLKSEVYGKRTWWIYKSIKLAGWQRWYSHSHIWQPSSKS